MTETLELTQAEKEMIALKREQEALKAREKMLQEQAQLEKDIAVQKNKILADGKEDAAQIAAATEFASKLPGFTMHLSTREATVKVTKWEDGDNVTLWSEKYERTHAHFTDGDGYTIRVVEHITWGNGWRARSTNHGYKMYISGPGLDYKIERRAYKNPKTALAAIDDAKKQIAYEKAAKAKQANALTTTVEKLQAKYPDATVTTGYDYERSYGRSYSLGAKYDTATVAFANGVTMTFRVYPDGSLSRKEIKFPNLVEGNWDLMDVLAGINWGEKIAAK